MSEQSYAPTMAPAAPASSKQDEERSTKGTSKMLLRLTSAKRAASKFKNALQRKNLNGRSVAETTTPILPAIQVSIASKENISALLAQVDASCAGAPRSDRRSRKANNRRATVYATYYGDESQEIPSPAPVRAASPPTASSIMSAMDDVLSQHISSWSSLDAPTPAAEPASLMAVIDGILLGRDSESALEKSGPRTAPAQLASPPATPLLVAIPAPVRALRVVKKKPSALCLRTQYLEHPLPTPPATPLPEPSSSLPGSSEAPTPSERVAEAAASLSLLAKIERMEKKFEKGRIGRRQQWAEWDAQVTTILSDFEPLPTSASLETIKPARDSIVFENVAAPIVDTEEDTDFYMCLCPLGRASTAEEKTARRTSHVVHYLAHPPEDFRCDRAYHALIRRWGHLVSELPAGSPVPEEFFRSLLA